MKSNQHELNRFFQEAAVLMRLEYERIHANSKKDPGTAGDESEENWRNFLIGWLPSGCHVVTKGQLINARGELSPQVDVVILHPTYPPQLRSVKKYLTDLVVAAFECKLTLRKGDIEKTVENAKRIQRLFKPRMGSLYKETYSPLTYGLLAHSHDIDSNSRQAAFKIAQTLYELDEKIVEHPREALDFVCVSNLVTIARSTQAAWINKNHERFLTYYSTLMSRQWASDDNVQDSQPLAQMVAALLRRLAREDPGLVRLAQYFRDANVGNATGGGVSRSWNLSMLTPETILELTRSNHAYEKGDRDQFDNLCII
jgi:hypothetical protein